MAELMVSIAGRSYRMFCEDGEEERLSRLAERLDRTIEDLKTRFGEVGDRRLLMMSGLALLDTVEEQARRLESLAEEVRELRRRFEAAEGERAAAERLFATTVHDTAEAIEVLTRRLTDPAEDLEPL